MNKNQPMQATGSSYRWPITIVAVGSSSTAGSGASSPAANYPSREDINRFPRFDVMRHWHDVDHMEFKMFVSPDGLHMNDWGYGCLAKALAVTISEAAQRPALSVTTKTQVVR